MCIYKKIYIYIYIHIYIYQKYKFINIVHIYIYTWLKVQSALGANSQVLVLNRIVLPAALKSVR